jgi:hypothetical protein
MRACAELVAILCLVCLGAAAASAAEFPIRDAQSALAIAKDVCRGKAASSLKWHAGLDNDGKLWIVDTLPSIQKRSDPLFLVKIPVGGPRPLICARVPFICGFCDRKPSRHWEVPKPRQPLAPKRNA